MASIPIAMLNVIVAELSSARKATTMAGKKRKKVVEWVGGLVSTPAHVTGEGTPYRPEALFWMSSDGAVLGHATGRPGAWVDFAAESLRNTIERPIFGRPHAPGRIRVCSPELAETLRASHTGIEIICAPTPEIDAVGAALRERMSEDAEQPLSYLSPDTGPDAIGALFRAAAGLFRAQPWKVVPDDQALLSVSIEELGVHEAVLSVIGQIGQSFGIVLFSGPDDFEAYLEAADAIEHGEEPAMPAHIALSFEREAELDPALRQEVLEHGWEVAGIDAHPWLLAVDEDLVARPPTARDVTLMEALALSLPHLLAERKALLAAWRGGDAVERSLVVATHAGDIEVNLRVPAERKAAPATPRADLLAELRELGQHGDDMDDELRWELEDELMQRFVDSPEARALSSDVQNCGMIMDLAANYFGATIATLDAPQLRELIFDWIPRKASIPASEASGIIEETRAFYAFLERELGLEQAPACLEVLDGGAVARLEAALSDPSKFGMAKSLFMGGRDASFDMDSKEGIEAWMRAMSGQLPASLPLPPFGAPRQELSRAAARAKKNQRKAARNARRKNRR